MTRSGHRRATPNNSRRGSIRHRYKAPRWLGEKFAWYRMLLGTKMLDKLSHYRAALYCASLIALGNCLLIALTAFQGNTVGIISTSIVSLVIPVGIWLASNLVRFVGAAFMVLWAGMLLWPIVSSGKAPTLPSLFFILLAALNLLTAAILLLSRKFATEFADERKNQPKYKTYLRRGLVAGIIGAVVIATANDIKHLLSN